MALKVRIAADFERGEALTRVMFLLKRRRKEASTD